MPVDLFTGLDITDRTELCAGWQNRWPVIFLTFKDVDDTGFENAWKKLMICIADLCRQHTYLLESKKVDREDIVLFRKYQSMSADAVEIQNALYVLMRMMNAYYGKQVIVLLDEYDVPLILYQILFPESVLTSILDLQIRMSGSCLRTRGSKIMRMRLNAGMTGIISEILISIVHGMF